MKAGLRSSFTKRSSENSTSSAVMVVAGMELDARADLEGEDLAVVADRPALGHLRLQLAGIGGVDHEQAIIGVRHVFRGAELVDLGRIERDDVIDDIGHDQRVCGRFRVDGSGRAKQSRPPPGSPGARIAGTVS